jgi:hypothetical protein
MSRCSPLSSSPSGIRVAAASKNDHLGTDDAGYRLRPGRRNRMTLLLAFKTRRNSQLKKTVFLGGTWHGFLQSDLLWKATVLSVGVASFAMLAGSAFAVLSGRLSVGAALVQASGFALYRHFNHNDLYHVIQIAAMVLLYRGARRLTDGQYA